MNIIRTVDCVVDALNLALIPDCETESFHKLQYGIVPRLVNSINFPSRWLEDDCVHHTYNCIKFHDPRGIPLNIMCEVWENLLSFPGHFYPKVYMPSLGRTAIFIHNDVVFFMFGLEIAYEDRRRCNYTVID